MSYEFSVQTYDFLVQILAFRSYTSYRLARMENCKRQFLKCGEFSRVTFVIKYLVSPSQKKVA